VAGAGLEELSAAPLSLLCAALAVSPASAKELTDTEELNRQSVNALREGLQERYAWRDARAVDWEATLVPVRSALIAAEDPAEFAARAAVVLGAARNPHLTLRSGERVWPTFTVVVDPGVSLERARARVPGLSSVTPSVASGRYADGVGYLLVSELSSAEGVHEAMLGMAGVERLVLDLRACREGDEDAARALAAWFLAEPAIYARHRVRPLGAPPGVSNEQSREVRQRADVRFEGPVAVLQSGANMGACETFLLMMQHANLAQRFGTTSYGSSESTEALALPNGVVVEIPNWQLLDASGALVEGAGVPPDTSVELVGGAEDLALEAALTWVRAWKVY